MNRKIFFLIVALVLLATFSVAQTVVSTTRLGNVIESSVTIPKGPNTGLAVLDGRSVKLIRGFGRERGPVKVLFTTENIPIRIEPRGMGYSAENDRFVFTDNLDSTHLYITDSKGNLTSTVTVAAPGIIAKERTEGIVWVPSTDSVFPNKFLVIINDQSTYVPYLWVVSQAGQVEQIIALDQVGSYLTGIAYDAGSRFIFAGIDDNSIVATDLSGNQLLRVPTGLAEALEGISTIPGGGYALVPGTTGEILFADHNLVIKSSNNVLKVGLGIFSPIGIAWDSDTQEFVSFAYSSAQPAHNNLYGIKGDFSLYRTIVDFGDTYPNYNHGTYLSDSQRIGLIRRSPAPVHMDFFTNQGAPAGSVVLGPTGIGVAFMSDTGQIATNYGVGFIHIHDPNTGALVKTLDITASGVTTARDIAYVNGNFYIPDYASGMIYRLDTDGNVLGTYDYLHLLKVPNPTGLAYIGNGPNAGRFAMYDSYDNAITIFSLP